MASVKLGALATEQRNPRTTHLDEMTPLEILQIMNAEDAGAIAAIRDVLPDVARAVALVTRTVSNGGRVFYVGAGTSGRLGILDAVECVPTFSTDRFVGVIAGGERAFVRAVEGAEDSEELAAHDLTERGLGADDVVVALAASGRTPYAVGSLKYAAEVQAATISISCNRPAILSRYADVAIEVDSGPEVLTGSTRLKAGTCQKVILNMISMASMVGIGKTYENLMVDMHASNEKLRERAHRIVMEATGCERQDANKALEESDYQCKTAIVMVLAQIPAEEAKRRLHDHQGHVRECL